MGRNILGYRIYFINIAQIHRPCRNVLKTRPQFFGSVFSVLLTCRFFLLARVGAVRQSLMDQLASFGGWKMAGHHPRDQQMDRDPRMELTTRNTTRWWFQRFFIFIPIWGNDPIWLMFFRFVLTTNQRIFVWFYQQKNTSWRFRDRKKISCVWVFYGRVFFLGFWEHILNPLSDLLFSTS